MIQGMAKIRLRSKNGFSLVEMLISIGLFVLVWIALMGSILMGKTSEVRLRHKIQATYAAQRAIEGLRKQPFDNIVNNSSSVVIDTRGTDSTSDDLNGTQTIMVTNYPNPPNTYYKRVIITIRWKERLPFGGSINSSEVLGTYMARDPQVN